MVALNRELHRAKRQKNDDFYTQRADIERELRHYQRHFRNKVVYCNCDDPTISNFFRYFQLKFRVLGLRKLITTCYKNLNHNLFSRHDQERAVGMAVTENGSSKDLPNIDVFRLEGEGDFRSQECIELLKQADIVVTNPPFSLFREYVSQLVEHDKKFLVIGPWNAVTYKNIFPLIRDNRIWLGYGFAAGNAYFAVPPDLENGYATGVYDHSTGLVKFRNVTWFTNLSHAKRQKDLICYKRYTPKEYPTYDNYNAINVNRVAEIPEDYSGVIGVPVTFLDNYNPDQFEIVGSNRGIDQDPGGVYGRGSFLDGSETWKRLFIRNKRPVS